MILDGEVDYLPEQAFLNVGTIEEAIEKEKSCWMLPAIRNKKVSMEHHEDLHLIVVSPESTLFDGKVEIVTLPGELGSFLSCMIMLR